MDLALFDLDGTLTKKDTFLDFIIFNHGYIKFIAGFILLSPILVLYKCKIIPNWRAKELILAFFFKGWSSERFGKKADDFSLKNIPKLLRDIGKKQLEWHHSRGDTIVIVSASIECWIKKWAEQNKCKLLATRLEYKDNKITGCISGKNCYGTEKVNRIKEAYNLDQFSTIYAYGDSRGDREMLNLAHKKYYKWELLHD